MNFIKKAAIIFSISTVFFLPHTFAQDSCYNCSIDSLTQVYQKTKTDPQKVELLTLLIDLRLLHIHVNNVNEMSLNDDSTANYIRSLIDLSKTQKVKDIDAYSSVLDAFQFFHTNNYTAGQNVLIKAIGLFDLSHKKIPRLLMFTRITFNFAGNQEDRLKYYTDKLNYYLVNGPIENTAPCYHAIAGYYLYKADYNLAISNYLKGDAIFKQFDHSLYLNAIGVIADAYTIWGNYDKAAEYYNKAIPLYKTGKEEFYLTNIYMGLSVMECRLGKYEDAILCADTSLLYNNNQVPDMVGIAHVQKALALISLNRLNEAWENLDTAQRISDSNHLKVFSAHGEFELDYGFYKYYSVLKKYDEAGKYLNTAYEKAVDVKSNNLQLIYLKELALFYGQQGNNLLAYTYTKKFFDLTDELNRQQSSFKVAQFETEEKELQQIDSINVLKQEAAVQAATIRTKNTVMWGSLFAILLVSVSLFFVYRQYRMNKKTLMSLRKTQRQLIMAEKMASLGELTAGIAHEIQNPLNFVNNFSEVNSELIKELKDEVIKGNMDEVSAIADDIESNSEKINHHGKRAGDIVKGMLQHSRTSTGIKEPTDINALADEYLRLSYHGLRAKDKDFNAEMKTDFDEGIGKINIIPQDIGRVLLNLYNNAFYAVEEKKKSGMQDYEPTVSVSTKK